MAAEGIKVKPGQFSLKFVRVHDLPRSLSLIRLTKGSIGGRLSFIER